jgi:hypothetical protein
MGAVRKRFTPQERKDYTAGLAVEVKNVSHWVPARIDDAVIHTCDITGVQSMWITYTGKKTRTLSPGQRWDTDAKSIRLPRAAEPTPGQDGPHA